MQFSRDELLRRIRVWLTAWDEYNLEGVMKLMHEDIIFENWTGVTTIGKNNLKRSWVPWFINHGNFKFIEEDIFIDEQAQKVLFSWRLEWPSLEKQFKGKPEVRHGVDVLHFKDGKIFKKISYSKTTLHIDSIQVSLTAKKITFNS